MITYHPNDQYWLTPADVRVNTVNCVGVMGKGIAKTFRDIFPEMYASYRGICKAGKLKPGDLHEYRYQALRIWNVATKDHWNAPSSYEWIEKCISGIVTKLQTLSGPHVITIPALGCGNGGLQWIKVKEMIDRQMVDLHHHIYVFEPAL